MFSGPIQNNKVPILQDYKGKSADLIPKSQELEEAAKNLAPLNEPIETAHQLKQKLNSLQDAIEVCLICKTFSL